MLDIVAIVGIVDIHNPIIYGAVSDQLLLYVQWMLYIIYMF